MIKPITFCLCTISAIVSPPATGQEAVDEEALQSVSGLLDAHREYPSFLPDDDSGLKVMAFSLREDQWMKWMKVYAQPVNEAYIHRPGETICFRITGKGFVAPRKPTMMQPWEGSQFIFVEVQKLEQLSSNLECASRRNANGS